MRSKLILAAPMLALLLAQAATRSGGSPATLTAAVVAPAPPMRPSSSNTVDDLREVNTGRRVAAFYAELARQEQERADAAAAAEAAKTQRQQAPRPSTSRTAPAPQPESAPAPAPVDGGDAEAAVRAWFPDLFSQAWGVSGCESHHNPSAVSSGGGNWGLFQINTVHKNSFTSVTGQPWSEVLNANYNAQFARWLYDSSGGWGPWACKWAAR